MTACPLIYVDVCEPVLNVFEAGDGARAPKVGETLRFGFPSPNTMSGPWRVLSIERVPSVSGRRESYLRVNVMRPEPLPQYEPSS